MVITWTSSNTTAQSVAARGVDGSCLILVMDTTSETDRNSFVKLPPSAMYTVFHKPDCVTLGIRSLASTERINHAPCVASAGSTSSKDISKREVEALTDETGPGT